MTCRGEYRFSIVINPDFNKFIGWDLQHTCGQDQTSAFDENAAEPETSPTPALIINVLSTTTSHRRHASSPASLGPRSPSTSNKSVHLSPVATPSALTASQASSNHSSASAGSWSLQDTSEEALYEDLVGGNQPDPPTIVSYGPENLSVNIHQGLLNVQRQLSVLKKGLIQKEDSENVALLHLSMKNLNSLLETLNREVRYT